MGLGTNLKHFLSTQAHLKRSEIKIQNTKSSNSRKLMKKWDTNYLKVMKIAIYSFPNRFLTITKRKNMKVSLAL
jgi:hypothetical protein